MTVPNNDSPKLVADQDGREYEEVLLPGSKRRTRVLTRAAGQAEFERNKNPLLYQAKLDQSDKD